MESLVGLLNIAADTQKDPVQFVTLLLNLCVGTSNAALVTAEQR